MAVFADQQLAWQVGTRQIDDIPDLYVTFSTDTRMDSGVTVDPGAILVTLTREPVVAVVA